MNDTEFDLLDELYFIQHFNDLVNTLGCTQEELKKNLISVVEKGWVRCYLSPSEEIDYDVSSFHNEYQNYYYLATKEGLFAHNSSF